MERLSKKQWLDHGLKTLAQSGFTALKADTLCKSLGVSRGSFYWHFANLAAFHAELLVHWQTQTVDAPISQVETTSADPTTRLQSLIQLALLGELDTLERAVRIWANSNPQVKAAVEAVDQQRLAYVEAAFVALGLSQQVAFARARITYFGYLGQFMSGEAISAENRALIANELIKMATTL